MNITQASRKVAISKVLEEATKAASQGRYFAANMPLKVGLWVAAPSSILGICTFLLALAVPVLGRCHFGEALVIQLAGLQLGCIF